uniref:Uncharacterized protein n=1 Tax=Anguilla anguilla TaxID=7936 RepID=A0A0E9WXU4_ANGAN
MSIVMQFSVKFRGVCSGVLSDRTGVSEVYCMHHRRTEGVSEVIHVVRAES